MRVLQIVLKNRKSSLHKTQTIPLSSWLLLILFAIIAFLSYNQPFDMRLTMLQSSDLIDCTLQGNFFHFYEYTLNKALLKGYFPSSESFMGAAYNIVVYISLAIWTIPVYMLNKLNLFDNYTAVLEQWGRFLMILVSIGAYVLLKKVAAKFMGDKESVDLTGFYFLSSPLLLYCVIVLNQFDIISVFLTLLALLFFFDKKYRLFSIILAIAVCFKLFSLLIFLPLILLAEKRIPKLLLHGSLVISLYAITTLIFKWLDSGYSTSQKALNDSYHFFERVTAVRLNGTFDGISLFIVSFIIVCVFAYCWRPNPESFKIAAILLCAVSYAVFFVFVEWHPQWFVIILPFLTMMIYAMKNRLIGILLDIAVTVSFLLFWIVNYFGSALMAHTFLYYFTCDGFNLTDDVNIIGRLLVSSGIDRKILFSVFIGFLIALLLSAVWDYRSSDRNPNAIMNKKTEHGLLVLRSALILIYLIPPIVVYFSHPVI